MHLQDLVYEGRRLLLANLQNLKEAINNKWKEVTIETVRKSIAQWKKRLNAVRKQKGVTIQTTFSANRCGWISISCSETCWTYWLFCTLRTPCVKTKAYNIIISYTVQLWLLFKMLFLFVWILLLSSTSFQNLGRFFDDPPGIKAIHR